MDDLDFRRAVLADPNAKTDEVEDAIACDPSKKQYVEEVRAFNAKIESAAKVDVPEDLASKLILRQKMASDDEPISKLKAPMQMKAANDGRYWQIASAACIAFVFGLMLNLSSLQPGSGMGAGEYALSYTYQDVNLGNANSQQVPLNQLNAKLASYGVQMEQDIGNVYYAQSYYCNYNDVNVMRLVVEGEAGNINLYILPKGNKLDGWDEFSDGRFNGKATRYSRADMVIVGEKGEPLNTFQSKVENSMKWAI